jgi:3-hydroxybutyryl-CoA dehydratase
LASIPYDALSVGDSAQFAKTISESDVYAYAGITGDFNPAHVNAEWAKSTRFERRIAHGMLVTGLISNVLGNQLPGNGTIFVSHAVKFLAPVYFGETIVARVEVVEKLEKKRVRLRTTCTNQNGDVVIDGEALVSPPRV